MKVGILGGTFDPIHLGHLRAAENAREALGLEKVLFVPTGTPPHSKEPFAPPLARFAMVALATSSHPAFVVSDMEMKRPGPSYTVDTVAEWLSGHHEDAVHLVVGSDTFSEMDTWKDFERLFRLCTVVVAPRSAEEAWQADARKPAVRVDGPSLCVSSTEVRKRVFEGRSVRFMVPDAVADYIGKCGLYR